MEGLLQMAGETQMAALLREIRQSIAEQIAPVAADAKEARDGVIQITSKLEGQNIESRLTKLSADVKAVATEFRSDMVNQHARLKQEMTDAFEDVDERFLAHDERLEALERRNERTDGATSFLAWMIKHLPAPLIAALISALTTLGVLKKL